MLRERAKEGGVHYQQALDEKYALTLPYQNNIVE